MPVLKYFVVVGAVLAGLLFIADAALSPGDKPVFEAAFDRNPQRTGIVLSTDLAPPPAPAVTPAPAPPVTTAAASSPVAASPPATASASEPTFADAPQKTKTHARKRGHAATRSAQARRDDIRTERAAQPWRTAERGPWQDSQDDWRYAMPYSARSSWEERGQGRWQEGRPQIRRPTAQTRSSVQARRQRDQARRAPRGGSFGSPWDAFAFAPHQRAPFGSR